MSPRLPLQVTRRAAREIRAASGWWDENRPAAPAAFRDAIAKAFELICTQPEIGSVPDNVTRQAVVNGDAQKIDALWDSLDLGDTSWWRTWKTRMR